MKFGMGPVTGIDCKAPKGVRKMPNLLVQCGDHNRNSA